MWGTLSQAGETVDVRLTLGLENANAVPAALNHSSAGTDN